MARIDVARVIVTHAVDKLWSHGLRPEQVLSVLTSLWVIVRNRPDRAAPYLLIGRDE
jgi:hypothetical protein